QLLRNVVGDQIGTELVASRIRGRPGQLQCALGSSQNLSICRTILLTSSQQRGTQVSGSRSRGRAAAWFASGLRYPHPLPQLAGEWQRRLDPLGDDGDNRRADPAEGF